MSILHLRSTSEPWASDTDEERLVFDNVKLNFTMDYENFFKSYEKQNQFSFDNDYISAKRNKPASPSPTYCRSRSSSAVSNIDAGCDINRVTPNYYSYFRNENRDASVENEGCRREAYELAESPRRLSRERNGRDRTTANRQHRDNDSVKSYSNYPIISPPPGFEDDVFKENANQCNLLAKSTRDYSPASHSPSSPYRGEFGARNSIYRKNTPNFHRKREKYNSSYYDATSAATSSQDTAGSHFVSNSNSAFKRNSYRSGGYSPNDQDLLENRRVKSSPDYYYYDDGSDYCTWNRDTVIPRLSRSIDHSTPSYTCHCSRCCVPLTSLPVHENGMVLRKSSYLGTENETSASILRNSPSRQGIRRSASFQNGCASPLYVNINNFGCNTVQLRNAEHRRRRPLYSTFDGKSGGKGWEERMHQVYACAH